MAVEGPWQSSTTFLHKELLFGADDDKCRHSFIPSQYFGENTIGDGDYSLTLKKH